MQILQEEQPGPLARAARAVYNFPFWLLNKAILIICSSPPAMWLVRNIIDPDPHPRNWNWRRPTLCGTRRAKPQPHNPPMPLPNRRPRALSITADTRNDGATLPRWCEQTQSPLFSRLPRDVRLVLYEHVVGLVGAVDKETKLCHPIHTGSALHVGWGWDQLVGIRCYDAEDPDRPAFDHACWVMYGNRDGAWILNDPVLVELYNYRRDGFFMYPGLRGPLAFLATCRLIYTEAVPFFYMHTTFSIRQNRCLLFLRRCLLPARLHAIRRLHLSTGFAARQYDGGAPPWRRDGVVFDAELPFWCPAYCSGFPDDPRTWREACGVLKEMRGLRELRVQMKVMTVAPGRRGDEQLVWLLAPLLDVRVGMREEERAGEEEEEEDVWVDERHGFVVEVGTEWRGEGGVREMLRHAMGGERRRRLPFLLKWRELSREDAGWDRTQGGWGGEE